MTVLKKLGIVVAGMSAIIGTMTACSEDPRAVEEDIRNHWLQRTAKNDFFERDIQLEDGTTVHCLFWMNDKTYKVGGMWCRELGTGDND